MKASELLSNMLVTIGPNASLDDARKTLGRCEIRHLPVVDDGRVVGMVSERDISIVLGRVQQPNSHSDETDSQETRIPMQVQGFMSSPVWCVDARSDVGEIIDMMLEYRISALPVTAKDKLIGVITVTDALRCLLDYCRSQPYDQLNRDTVIAHMSEPEVVADYSDYVHIVLASMVRMQSYYALVVLDDRLVGVISDRDLRRRLGVSVRGSLDAHPELHDSHEFRTAGQIMTSNPKTATADTLLTQAVSMMIQYRIGALPILNGDGTVAGLLSATDLMRVLRPLVAEQECVAA